ncbi:MAG: hypothetical protein KGJ55_09710 [Gammaproteobacteria bacterium]|nr:hypothetical protein [Gammaproteobacteria bacterium]
MSVTIVEVTKRSKQGRTQPYICRGDDGETYFVKGRAATRVGLAAEWICARLGERFGLSIAPYEIAVVPEILVESDATGWLADLGFGPVFASRRVEAVEFTEAHRDQLPGDRCADVAVFDWWVRNADRTLTVYGGNPNLLWNPTGDGSLVVIDHNLAFDPDFSETEFLDTHVFSDCMRQVLSDFVARRDYVTRLADALIAWGDICAMIPDPWRYIDSEMTTAADLPIDRMFRLLNRLHDESFWSVTP